MNLASVMHVDAIVIDSEIAAAETSEIQQHHRTDIIATWEIP